MESLSAFCCQINEISEIVWRSQRSVPASIVRVEGRSTVEDRRPRNYCHRVCYVFATRAASACHWNWTAVDDDQCLTEGGSTQERFNKPHIWAPQSWTQRADGLAASVAAVPLVWCGHTDRRPWPGGRQRSAPTAGFELVRRWCRTAVSCSSQGDMRWTPGQSSWWHSRTTIGLLVGAGIAGCNRSDTWLWHGPPVTAHGLWQH